MRFAKLEAVRGFAAAYICFGHIAERYYTGVTPFLLRFGQEAVMIFFVLSGFVISWTTPNEGPLKQSFGQYFWKRFSRIYSVWFLAVVALFAISSIEQHKVVLPTFANFAGNLFMLQDYASGKPAVVCDEIYDDHPLWSLHYEWWFYMFFPLTLYVADSRRRMHVVGIIAVLSSISYVIFPTVIARLLLYFCTWYIGAHAAICLRKNGRVTLRDVAGPLLYVCISSLPLVALVGVYAKSTGWRHIQLGIHPVLELRHLISAVAFVLIAFAWRSIKWIGFSATVGLFAPIAPISYSLYVIHSRSIAVATYLSFVRIHVIEMLLYLALTLLFCYFAELVVYPALRRLHRRA